VRPYGSGEFGELAGQAGLELDTRDVAAAPRRGTHVLFEGTLYPGGWDVDSTFGEVHGEAATYLTAPISLHPTLALRAGGRKVWGDFPYQDAAYVGGGSTVRGLSSHRFLGDASAYGNAELRLPLSHLNLLAPFELGIFGLADAGRVWVTGENSNTWHSAFGGGLSLAFLNAGNTFTVAVAHGDNQTSAYLSTGFMF
jgi:outer membrane protein assembly factor BamA